MNKAVQAMIDNLQAIDLNQIENKVCCGTMEAYRNSGFEWPLDRPIMWSKNKDMYASGWYISMMPSLESGKPDSKNRIRLQLDYCPFCGAKLTEEREP